MSVPHWACTGCGLLVGPGTGYVACDPRATAPSWRAWHARCDPEPGRWWYAIRVERLASWRDVAAWTAHLGRKRWFARSDWAALIERARVWRSR